MKLAHIVKSSERNCYCYQEKQDRTSDIWKYKTGEVLATIKTVAKSLLSLLVPQFHQK